MAEQFPEDEINDAAQNVLGEGTSESEERWWEDNYVIRKRIHAPLIEGFKARTFDKDIDILNYTKEQLTRDEVEQLSYALSAVADFTGGKAFDRTPGVVLAPASSFPRKTNVGSVVDSMHVAGDVGKYFPVIMINMDAMRHPPDDTFPRFAAQRLPGRKATLFIYTVAHEFGHIMDLIYVSEIEKHGFDMYKAVPYWQGFYDITDNFTAFEHPDPSIFVLEPSLSKRARENAIEDFAESFAIASLGGDVTAIPRKFQRMAETIRLAKGQPVVGPHKVSIAKKFIRL